MESVWKKRLTAKSWSEDAQEVLPHCWAESTLRTYNRTVSKFAEFCSTQNVSFPPTDSCYIADFLLVLARQSTRPKSVLNNTTAALGCLYDGIGDIPNPLHDRDIARFLTALTKTHTIAPRRQTPVLPIQPIKDLFLTWEDNSMLSIKSLRQKTLALLALVMMLRPSDAAPRALVYDSDKDVYRRFIFSTDHITFHDDNCATITLHGIKNDYQRDGFDIRIESTGGDKLDPVHALRDYIARTSHLRPADSKPVFLTLNKPHQAISSSTVAKVLEEVIALAGLDTTVYKAKCFRPTGATVGIESECHSDVIRQVGRWRNRDVFEEHYVHTRAQRGVATKILSNNICE